MRQEKGEQYACALPYKRERGIPVPDACWGIGTMCPMCHEYKAVRMLKTIIRKRR